MNTKRVKKLAALGLAAVMLLGYGNSRVMAFDGEIVKESFYGTEVTASVAFVDDTSANAKASKCVNAVTRYSRGGVTITARAGICYSDGKVSYVVKSQVETASAGGAGAFARVQKSNCLLELGCGWHTVSCNGETWTKDIYIYPPESE